MMNPDKNQRFPSWQETIAAMRAVIAQQPAAEESAANRKPAAVGSRRSTSSAPVIHIQPKVKATPPVEPERPVPKQEQRKRPAVAIALAAGCVVAVVAALRYLPPGGAAPGGAAKPERPRTSPSKTPPRDEAKAIQVYYEKFSLAVPGVSPPAPASDESVTSVIAELEKANAGLERFQVFYSIRDGFVSLDMSGNPGLIDISALSQLPVRELRLQGTGVSDLSALHGLPLEKLVLNDTPVADLSPLRALPLKELSLWQCRDVLDVTPLADLRELTRLLLPGHVTNVEPLRNHPSIQFISSDPDGWKQTSSEFWTRMAARNP